MYQKIYTSNQSLRSKEKCGAPFLRKFPELSIFISHSGSYAVAGIGTSGAAVAVDIEKIVYDRMKSISGVAFTERELDHLQNAEEEFYINWTRKEAFVKYLKKGFIEGLKNVEILNGAVIHNDTPVKGISIDSEILTEDYAFTIIYKKLLYKGNFQGAHIFYALERDLPHCFLVKGSMDLSGNLGFIFLELRTRYFLLI